VHIAGSFDLFPTFDAGAGDFVVAGLEQIRSELNRIPGSGGVRAVNEVWVKAQPGVRAESISLPAGSRPSAVVEAFVERERFRLDPLIETGWQGLLLIAFLTIAVLSSLGMLIYAYLAAQARRLDFAVLRTMGLSANQIFGLVGFEQLLVVGLGLVSGSLIGSRLGVLLLASLELTESGERVTPPYVMEINWFAAGVAYGVIGFVFMLSVLFLVLFFSRLSLHRMLRIGEV
jgi:putative ABC transport system permease protein